MVPHFLSSWDKFSKCVTCLANPFATRFIYFFKEATAGIQDIQRSMMSSCTTKDTTYNYCKFHLFYLKCKYTYDKPLFVQFFLGCVNPLLLNKKGHSSLCLFFRCLFVGYSWLERISICLSGACKPAQISASCWAKAQLNPCKPNVYPMWK